MNEDFNTLKLNTEVNPLKLESKKLNVIKQDGSACNYVVQLETVISGHDGWVYGVHWNPNVNQGIL